MSNFELVTMCHRLADMAAFYKCEVGFHGQDLCSVKLAAMPMTAAEQTLANIGWRKDFEFARERQAVSVEFGVNTTGLGGRA